MLLFFIDVNGELEFAKELLINFPRFFGDDDKDRKRWEADDVRGENFSEVRRRFDRDDFGDGEVRSISGIERCIWVLGADMVVAIRKLDFFML